MFCDKPLLRDEEIREYGWIGASISQSATVCTEGFIFCSDECMEKYRETEDVAFLPKEGLMVPDQVAFLCGDGK